MSRPIWPGLAVIDATGKLVLWRGSETPKLYHSEEQAERKVGRTDGCTFEAVVLMRVTAAELAQVRHGTLLRTAHTPSEDARPTFVHPVAADPAPTREQIEGSMVAAAKGRAMRERKKPTYRPRHCVFPGCGATFTPSGGRATHCDKHRRAA